MTFLLFLVDVCFYNYTSLKTYFLLLSIFDKRTKLNIIFYLLIDLIIGANFLLFITYTLLFILNKFLKLRNIFLRFTVIFLIYKLLIFVVKCPF